MHANDILRAWDSPARANVATEMVRLVTPHRERVYNSHQTNLLMMEAPWETKAKDRPGYLHGLPKDIL